MYAIQKQIINNKIKYVYCISSMINKKFPVGGPDPLDPPGYIPVWFLKIILL